MLLLRAERQFDWERLVRMAATRRWSLGVARCVEYLSEGLEVVVPEGVPRDLRSRARVLEHPYLGLRSSVGIGYRVHTLLMLLRTAGIDGVRHLPHRLRVLPRFVRWRLQATPDAPWSELAARMRRR